MDEGLPAENQGEVRVSMPIMLYVRGLAMALVFIGLVAALHYYVGVRLIRAPGLPAPLSALGWTAVWLLFFSLPVGFSASRWAPRVFARPVQWVAYFWLGAFGLLLTAVTASDVVVLALRLALAPGLESALSWARFQAAAVGLVAVPALVLGFLTARGKASVERVNIHIPHLGEAFEGLRIVQITDVHIGETLRKSFLERVVEQVNALEADIVAITGDLVDGSVARLREEVAALRNLRAKHGVFYVTGNHEYYHGGPAWEAEVRRLGIHVLHNEHKVIRSGEHELVVAGVTDHDGAHFGEDHAPRPDLAFAGAPERAARILLAHQPRIAPLAAPHRVDLQLSGHTHGGQMFPFMFFVRLQQPVISGLERLSGVLVYTSRGTGYWGPPIRLGPKPEVAVLTLTRTQP
jgi:uncharacterized protein